MGKTFGTWLKNYSGDDEQIEALSLEWRTHVATNYVPAKHYTTPDQVAFVLCKGMTQPKAVRELLDRAYGECQAWRTARRQHHERFRAVPRSPKASAWDSAQPMPAFRPNP